MRTRLYFSHQLETLAAKLGEELLAEHRSRDQFASATVVVPNPNLKRWLQLELSRRHGIVANVDFQYAQEGLWKAVAQLQPQSAGPATVIAHLTPEKLQLMVLALLLGNLRGDSELGRALTPVASMLYDAEGRPCRNFAQRLWQLAGRLAT